MVLSSDWIILCRTLQCITRQESSILLLRTPDRNIYESNQFSTKAMIRINPLTRMANTSGRGDGALTKADNARTETNTSQTATKRTVLEKSASKARVAASSDPALLSKTKITSAKVKPSSLRRSPLRTGVCKKNSILAKSKKTSALSGKDATVPSKQCSILPPKTTSILPHKNLSILAAKSSILPHKGPSILPAKKSSILPPKDSSILPATLLAKVTETVKEQSRPRLSAPLKTSAPTASLRQPPKTGSKLDAKRPTTISHLTKSRPTGVNKFRDNSPSCQKENVSLPANKTSTPCEQMPANKTSTPCEQIKLNDLDSKAIVISPIVDLVHDESPLELHVTRHRLIENEGYSVMLTPETPCLIEQESDIKSDYSSSRHTDVYGCDSRPNDESVNKIDTPNMVQFSVTTIDTQDDIISSIVDEDVHMVDVSNGVDSPSVITLERLHGGVIKNEPSVCEHEDLPEVKNEVPICDIKNNNSIKNDSIKECIDTVKEECAMIKEEVKGQLAERDAGVEAAAEESGVAPGENSPESPTAKKKAKKRSKKRKRKKTAEGEEADDSGTKQRKLPPNYFIAVPITDKQILEKARMVQQHVVQKVEALAPAAVPIATMHLTMLVLRLDGEEAVAKAQSALKESARVINDTLWMGTTFHVHSLGNFRNNVLYAHVHPGRGREQLQTIADIVVKVFDQFGLRPTDAKGYKPHLTLMKMSRAPNIRKKGIDWIDPESYIAHRSLDLGIQDIRDLQLCAMMKPRQQNGYYHLDGHEKIGDKRRQIFRENLVKTIQWSPVFSQPPDSPQSASQQPSVAKQSPPEENTTPGKITPEQK